MKDAIMRLIADYAEEHELAKSCGSEYITQNDSAQEDALQLVCDIFDLFADKLTLEQLLEKLEDEDKPIYLYCKTSKAIFVGNAKQLNAVLGNSLRETTIDYYVNSGDRFVVFLDEIF